MSSREIDAFLEERLDDINELIQSELGFPSLNITEPFTAPEIHNLSFLLETEGTSIGLLSDNILPGNDAASSISGQESSNKVSEVEVEIQLIDLKDVYNKKTKKTEKGLKYCLEDSEVTVVAQASDEITSIRAYTQRCAEAAIRTHDTVGPVELDINVLQSDSRCRVVAVDLGSVFKTREGDEVYRLEKADVVERNKWEMIIVMEFSSGLKGTVKTGAFRVTTKAKYKVKKNVEDSSSSCNAQRLFGKFTWSDNNNNRTDRSEGNNFLPKRGRTNQEFPNDETCALNRELMAFKFMEEDHCEARCQFADDSRANLKSISGSAAEEKILLQHHTVLDRHMVTTYYRHNPKICYVAEQSDPPGMLKLVGKRSLQVSAGHKADCRKTTKQVFWWACGRCFFERQKKSSIKAHIIQRVCQRPINVKAPRRKSTSRHSSPSELQEDTFEGYSWKDSLSA